MSTRELARQSLDLVVGSPRFVTAPLRRHLRWGATDDEVRVEMPIDKLLLGIRTRAEALARRERVPV